MGVGYGIDLVRIVGDSRDRYLHIDEDGNLRIKLDTTDDTVKITDADDNVIGRVFLQNELVETKLGAILKELRIMNMHLATITDNFITKQEVE